MVIFTKTYTLLVSVLSQFVYDFCQNLFFWTSKQPFAKQSLLATCNVHHVVIPVIFAQTQGSDFWQLIHWLKFTQKRGLIPIFNPLVRKHMCRNLSTIIREEGWGVQKFWRASARVQWQQKAGERKKFVPRGRSSVNNKERGRGGGVKITTTSL